jgi:cell division protein FtsQ
VTSVVRLLPRAFALVPRLAAPLGAHWRRRLLILAAVAMALAAAYLLWFRDSSFVRVEQVKVSGLATAPEAGRLKAELSSAAERMTTLHLDRAALERVVADDPVVHSIRVVPDFPHGLTIEVVENRPVAVVEGDTGRVPVAADGTLLEGVEMHGTLPEVRTTTAVPSSGRLDPGPALDRVVVAGAAPPALLAKVASITIQPEKGYVAQIDDGPAVWLGDRTRLASKWDAAAAVLAQPTSAGASYVDVRTPERAVAGGLIVETEPQEAPTEAAPEAAPAEPVPVPEEPLPAAPAAPPAAPTDPQPSLEP